MIIDQEDYTDVMLLFIFENFNSAVLLLQHP